MNERHPSETDLALLAGGDCGRVRRFLLNRHVARCGDCRDALASFGELRSAVRNVAAPELDWDRLAGEMRANIRVGLAAGECVRDVPATASRGNRLPQLAFGMAGLLLLAGAGVFLHGLLPRQADPAAAHAVAESTGAGVRVRTDSGSSMTLLDPSAKAGDSEVDRAVTSQGAIRASYVDGSTGTVTVTSVYVE